ncbi:MAG: DUF1415 family protein [Myxococcota bacterium]
MSEGKVSPEEAIARYDRYLQEFVEELNVCPFARKAREEGRLARMVCEVTTPDVEAAVQSLLQLAARPRESLDVAVLIFSCLEADWSSFNRYVGRIREAFTPRTTPPGEFYLVAMHPESPMDLANPDRAVAFMRRTPHPSIQVARASVIQSARKGTGFGPGGVPDAVARTGLENVQRFGPERARQLLDDIRRGRK